MIHNPRGECGRGHRFRPRAFQWTAEWIESAASAVSLLWWWQNRRWQAWRPHRPALGPAWSAQTRRAHSCLHTAVGGAGWSPGAQRLQPSQWTQRCLCWGFWWPHWLLSEAACSYMTAEQGPIVSWWDGHLREGRPLDLHQPQSMGGHQSIG